MANLDFSVVIMPTLCFLKLSCESLSFAKEHEACYCVLTALWYEKGQVSRMTLRLNTGLLPTSAYPAACMQSQLPFN